MIDIQQGWVHKTATEAVMLRCVELAQEFTGDVIHCCFRNTPDSVFETELNWRRFREPSDTDQTIEMAALGLPVYWRDTYSCLTPEVTKVVRQYDHVYVAGVFTDASVFATALAVFDLGIPVTVIKYCVATLHGAQIHEYALRVLEHLIDRKNVVNSEELPTRLLVGPTTD